MIFNLTTAICTPAHGIGTGAAGASRTATFQDLSFSSAIHFAGVPHVISCMQRAAFLSESATHEGMALFLRHMRTNCRLNICPSFAQRSLFSAIHPAYRKVSVIGMACYPAHVPCLPTLWSALPPRNNIEARPRLRRRSL